MLAFATLKVPHPQILERKLSRIATKVRNSQKFSASKVSHYMVHVPGARVTRSELLRHNSAYGSDLFLLARGQVI